jgi:hypothetical protein
MLWLKRNLVLAISGVVTLVLLAAGVLYFMSGLQENQALEADLEKATNAIKTIYGANPFPDPTNIARAKLLAGQVRAAVDETKKHFVPIAYNNVKDQQFKTLLDNTLADLQTKAEQAGVKLPETNYAFTFKAQKTLVKFAEGSWPGLPHMLAEIKTLCFLIFDSKCSLLNLRRERLTTDDPPGSTEFTELKREINPVTGAALVPYEVVVSCFSAQLSTLLESLARSPHGLLAKVLAVEPLSGQSAEVKPNPGQPVVAPVPGGGVVPVPGRRGFPVTPRAAPGAAPEASDNQVVLIQQSLKVTLLVRVVRPEEAGSGPGPGQGGGRAPGSRPTPRRQPPPR